MSEGRGPPKTLPELQAEHGKHVGSRVRAPHGEMAEMSPFRNYVRDLVLGFNDGLVSVFAVTAGVAGAAFVAREVLVAGIAASVAGALSMAAGEYISTKSQTQYYASERAREELHLETWPELERQELRESLGQKGIHEPLLTQVVDSIASDKEKFLDYMMRDEFGVGSESARSPVRAAIIVMGAFLIGALFAVTPYALLENPRALQVSAVLSTLGLFVAGAVRARASRLPMLRAGAEMVLIGAFAAALTYGIGWYLGFSV